MRPIVTHLVTAGLLMLALQLSGQALNTTFAPATITAPVGGTVSLQLKVSNFTNITSLQLPITYNSAVLQFTSISNATLPGFSAANYNATSGKVTVSWYPDLGQYPSGYTTADNSSIFTINFTVLADGSSKVNIADVSPKIEVTRNNNVITVNYANGGTNVTAGAGGTGPLTGFHIIANTIYIPKGETKCMPVKVNDFDNVLLASYVMHWDATVLQYTGTQAYNLPDLSASSFSNFPSGSGNLILSWFDNNVAGVTRPDGATIYEVCFKGIGNAGTSSLVTVDGTGFPVGGGPAEVIDLTNKNLWKSDAGVTDTIFVTASAPPPNAVTFTADKDTVATGQVACVDVKVKNFTDVISMQLGMTYDATKIQFKEIQFGSNPLQLSNANFNPNVPGEIKFTWFDPNALGVDLADNSMIFSICFTAVGAGGTQSPFNFSSLTGFAIEIVKEPGGEVTPALNNGSVTITAFLPPVVNLTPTGVSCNGGTTGSIATSITNGGASPTFKWTGPNNFSSTTQNPSGLVAGTYTVTVTGAGGMTSTATTTISQPQALAITTPVTTTGVTCFGGSDGAITMQTTGGTSPYTFTWSGPNGYTSTSNGASGTSLSGLKSGNYIATVTDTRGCSTVSAQIGVATPQDIAIPANQATVSNVTCFGLTNGSITIANPSGGTSPYTYDWSNGQKSKSITGLAANTYTVTLTDSKSCTKTFQYMVTGPMAALNVSLQSGSVVDATCFGANNGKAAVTVTGGTQPYVVSWRYNSPSGATLATGLTTNSLPPGNIYPVVTDNAGCTATMGSPVAVGGPLNAIEIGTPTVQNIKCPGETNGCITVTPTGGNGAPFTVTWTGNKTGANICDLSPGSYTPTVSDSKGCTIAFSAVNITAPSPFVLDTDIVEINPPATGTVDIKTLNGGTSPYTYNWTGPNGFTAATQDLTGLQTAGTYKLTITDANGCTKLLTAEVASTNVLPQSILTVSPSCNDDGCLNFNVPTTAMAPLLVTWAGGSYLSFDHQFSICNFPSGVYTPTIADANGSTYTFPATFIPQLQQALAGSSINNPFDDAKNGSITLTPIPSNANLSFKWSNGILTKNLMNIDSGLYKVTVTNVTSGCTSVYEFQVIRQYLPPNGSFNTTQSSCLNTNNGKIDFTFTGADGPNYKYKWVGPGGFTGTTQDVNNALPGTYTVTVTDESNNQYTYSTTITAQSQLTLTNVNELSNYNGFQVSSTQVCDGRAMVVYSGNSGNVTINWSNGVTGATNNTLCGGAYTVTVTDQLGCTSSWSDSLTVPSSVVATGQVTSDYNGFNVPCHGSCAGVAKVYVVGGVPPYTVKWPNGQTDQVFQVNGFSQANQLCAGTYKVTVTDANGATNGVTSVTTVTVTQPDPLAITFADVEPSALTTCDGQVIASVPDAYGTITFTWSSVRGILGDTTGTFSQFRVEDLCAGDVISFVVETEFGCTATGAHLVPYPGDDCLKVRPIITPAQQDGKNDYTLIACIEKYPNNSFEVYNRWGQLVFETTGYDNDAHRWEGLTGSGQVLPDGVYFFVLKYVDDDGNQQEVKGYINLLK